VTSEVNSLRCFKISRLTVEDARNSGRWKRESSTALFVNCAMGEEDAL